MKLPNIYIYMKAVSTGGLLALQYVWEPPDNQPVTSVRKGLSILNKSLFAWEFVNIRYLKDTGKIK